jgi:uncharacterized protein (DUF1501 family)
MDRRRFLKVAGIAGLSMMAPIAVRDRDARAGINLYKGPYWIMLNAGGGWDATMLCDPKGGANSMDPKAVDHAYTPSQILHAGNISYAPVVFNQNMQLVYSADAFFQKHHGRLTIINGVDTSTNNHDAGTRTTWSGMLTEGFPSFAALVAAEATTAQQVAIPFVSNGGYDVTGGAVSLTRVGSPDALEKLAFPNSMNPSDPKTDHYHTANTMARIQAAQAARCQAVGAKQSLPTVAAAMNALYLARGSNDGLVALGSALTNIQLVSTDSFPDLKGIGGLDDLSNLMQQAQLALTCFKTGVAVSANLSIGGFDTHSNNDADQTSQLMKLLRGLDYIFTQVDAMGLTNQVYVVVGSDFSRTPYYNAGNGKDHWNITSMMFAGPKIPGDRVLGGTDDTFTSISVDPMSLKQAMAGERIGTTTVHFALRQLAGLTGTDLDTQFPLTGDTMPLFS